MTANPTSHLPDFLAVICLRRGRFLGFRLAFVFGRGLHNGLSFLYIRVCDFSVTLKGVVLAHAQDPRSVRTCTGRVPTHHRLPSLYKAPRLPPGRRAGAQLCLAPLSSGNYTLELRRHHPVGSSRNHHQKREPQRARGPSNRRGNCLKDGLINCLKKAQW